MTDESVALIPGEPIDPPPPAQTVPESIRQRARRHPEAIAIVDGMTRRELAYGALDRLIGRCATGLAARGFRPGDTLLLFSPNSPEWVVVALGALAAGGRVTGANPSCTAAELGHQTDDVVSPNRPSRYAMRARWWQSPASAGSPDPGSTPRGYWTSWRAREGCARAWSPAPACAQPTAS